jgi:hypothetical protein
MTNNEGLVLNETTKLVLQERDGGDSPLEPAILPLVNAVNSLPGIRTRSSCGGHPDRYPFVHIWADGTQEAMGSLCIVAHALKSFYWKLLALPIGSIGELRIEFLVLPGIALKEWEPDQPAMRIVSSSSSLVEAAQAEIPAIGGRIGSLKKTSRYVPQDLSFASARLPSKSLSPTP